MPPKGVNKKQAAVKTFGKFTVSSVDESVVGEKIQIYGSGGSGKSTLASLADKPIMIPLSDGSRKIRKPDGSRIPKVDGITTFQDLRDALVEPGIWEDCNSVILDDTSELEMLAEQHVVDTYPAPKKQGKVTSLRQFGYDGSGYLVEVMRLALRDLENLLYQGKHIILISHERLVKVASAEGFDYVEGGPDLQHNAQYSVRNTVYNWCDDVVQIDFADKVITRDPKEKSGKIEAGDERVIFTKKSAQFLRKSRQLESTGKSLPSEIAFSSPVDDSFWKFVEGAEVG
jgi:energy-coupling factor transporter ATP-binding protein EcfA2